MKNRYIVGSIALLLLLFTTVMFILPNSNVDSIDYTSTYKTSIFDHSQVTTVDIVVNDKDLESILENPLDEELVDADATINGRVVKNVGFRTKGNMTLSSVASSDSDRYSFKIDFDYYQDDQNIDGLKKLNLNNGYSDSTQIREYLSYSLMEKMGIATPGYSYMYVTINGEEWGLYLGVEAIEETFLSENFEDGTGDLYYPDGTGSDLKWISDDVKDYTGLNLKTNKKTSDQTAIMNLLDVINNGGDLTKVVDVDEMLRYFALNTALVNLDHYQGSMKHNYYLYEKDGIFSILPWDYNMSFGGFSGGRGGRGIQPENNVDDTNNTDTNKKANDDGGQTVNEAKQGIGGNLADMSADFMSDSNINLSITTPVSGTTLEDRPLLNALLSNDEYRNTYNQYLKEIATTYFTEDYMSEMTAEIATLITPYVEKDPTSFYTVDQFLEGIEGENSLVTFSTKRAESILAQLSGELVVEAETTNAFGGGQPPNMNGGDGQNMQPPDTNGSDGQNMQPPDMNGGDGQNMQPPGMNGGDEQNFQPGGMNGRGGGNMPFNNGEQQASFSWKSLFVTSGSVLVLIGSIIFAKFYKRRK